MSLLRDFSTHFLFFFTGWLQQSTLLQCCLLLVQKWFGRRARHKLRLLNCRRQTNIFQRSSFVCLFNEWKLSLQFLVPLILSGSWKTTCPPASPKILLMSVCFWPEGLDVGLQMLCTQRETLTSIHMQHTLTLPAEGCHKNTGNTHNIKCWFWWLNQPSVPKRLWETLKYGFRLAKNCKKSKVKKKDLWMIV